MNQLEIFERHIKNTLDKEFVDHTLVTLEWKEEPGYEHDPITITCPSCGHREEGVSGWGLSYLAVTVSRGKDAVRMEMHEPIAVHTIADEIMKRARIAYLQLPIRPTDPPPQLPTP